MTSNNYVDILRKHRVFNIEETNENDLCSSLVPRTVIERDRSVKRSKVFILLKADHSVAMGTR